MIQAIGMAMQIGGGIMSAFGKRKAAKRAKAESEYNAKVLEAQAEVAATEGRESFRREHKNIEAKLSSIRARLASQGSVSNVGAPLAIIGDVTTKLEMSVLDAYRAQESRRTISYLNAKSVRAGGQAAYKNAKMGIFSSLLGTGAQAASNLYERKQANPIE